jgi:hypothetical protein
LAGAAFLAGAFLATAFLAAGFFAVAMFFSLIKLNVQQQETLCADVVRAKRFMALETSPSP